MVFIGVLFGAGSHVSIDTQKAIKRAVPELFSGINQQLTKLEEGVRGLVELAASLTAQIEDLEFTNAGRGSELNLKGDVECDAMVILQTPEKKLLGCCGGVPKVKNPVNLASNLLCDQMQPPKSLAFPNFLVGQGALDYALSKNLETADLWTPRAQSSHEKWSKYVDTIGIIVSDGVNTVVCMSSGGSLLKTPGRIGPACLVGCGGDTLPQIGAVCSGLGEDIITIQLANKACPPETDLESQLKNVPGMQATNMLGVLKLYATPNQAHFEWAHTAPSMALAIGQVSTTHCEYKFVNSQTPCSGGAKFDAK